jgi:hypothetical protein
VPAAEDACKAAVVRHSFAEDVVDRVHHEARRAWPFRQGCRS